ncbi:MAG: hypothetical protein IT579_16075 [Verrucomicrobia subdivision 3 bacterium]|nr:hypothetical protein [Limisphaerales bacterium]
MKTKLHLLAAGIFLVPLGTGWSQSTLQFSANYYYGVENAGSVILTVQRTEDSDAVVSVDYASADGTATNGLDYATTNGTLTFLAGETNQVIAVPILNDGIVEATDTVLVAGGVCATGGRAVNGSMTDRVAIDRAITVESLMGQKVTIIQGYPLPGTTNGDGAIRCVDLANRASLPSPTAGPISTIRSGRIIPVGPTASDHLRALTEMM